MKEIEEVKNIENKAKGFIGEFKEFISKGNVLDMAVGVIIATAFGKITTSLVNEVFMPFLGWLIGGIDLAKLNVTLAEAEIDAATGEVAKEAVVIALGSFLSTIIDFVMVAFVVFLVIKAFNKAKTIAEARKAKEEAKVEEAVEEAPAEPSEEVKLLSEIRDLLKK